MTKHGHLFKSFFTLVFVFIFCSLTWANPGSHIYRGKVSPSLIKETLEHNSNSQQNPKLKSATKKTTTTSPAAPPQVVQPNQEGHGDLHLNVRAAFLVNMNTGQVYYEYNADEPMAPASITKVLTLYLIEEALNQGLVTLETLIPISTQAVKTGGSRMSLRTGEQVPLKELMEGISVVSANNACVAVAEYLTQGNPAQFIAQMNAKAQKLGMTQSKFKNTNGLPIEGQLSTARDLAKLSISYLQTFPQSLKTHALTTHTYSGVTHSNANSLLRTYKGADGLKTGFVCASGYSIAATAKRGDIRLVAVVLGAANAIVRQIETTKLLNYGFNKVAADMAMQPSQGQKKSQKGV